MVARKDSPANFFFTAARKLFSFPRTSDQLVGRQLQKVKRRCRWRPPVGRQLLVIKPTLCPYFSFPTTLSLFNLYFFNPYTPHYVTNSKFSFHPLISFSIYFLIFLSNSKILILLLKG